MPYKVKVLMFVEGNKLNTIEGLKEIDEDGFMEFEDEEKAIQMNDGVNFSYGDKKKKNNVLTKDLRERDDEEDEEDDKEDEDAKNDKEDEDEDAKNLVEGMSKVDLINFAKEKGIKIIRKGKNIDESKMKKSILKYIKEN